MKKKVKMIKEKIDDIKEKNRIEALRTRALEEMKNGDKYVRLGNDSMKKGKLDLSKYYFQEQAQPLYDAAQNKFSQITLSSFETKDDSENYVKCCKKYAECGRKISEINKKRPEIIIY